MIKFLQAGLTGVTTVYLWVKTVLLARSTLGARFWQRLTGLRYGFTPNEYALFDLRHNDPTQYIPWGVMIKRRTLNAPFTGLLNDVVVCHEAIGQRLPTQQVLACIGPAGQLRSHRPDVAGGVLSLLEDADLGLKWGQYGDLSGGDHPGWLLQDREGQLLLNGQPVSRAQVESWLRRLDGYCIVEQVTARPLVSGNARPIVGEFEITMVADEQTGALVTCAAVLRLGEPYGADRLVAGIDVATGALTATRSLRSSRPADAAVGGPTAGLVVPHWAAIRQAAEAVPVALPFFKLVTVRGVWAAQGFTVTGASAHADTISLQLSGGLAHSALGKLLGCHHER